MLLATTITIITTTTTKQTLSQRQDLQPQPQT